MFAIERFQLEDVEEGPAPPHQGQEDLQKANKKGDRGGGSSNRQQSQLLAEHLARVRARKEARLQEQQEGGKQQEGAADVIDKRDKKKRKREEGAAPERPTAEAAAEAVGEQDDGDEERRKRKKEKKERKKLQDNTARAHPPASASEEAPAAEPDPEMKRTSGLDTVRRLLSGHLMKGRAVPAAQQPPQQAPQRAVAPGPPSAEEEKPVKAAERKQEEQRKKEKEGERAVAAEDGALSVGAACTKWGLDARLAPALEAQGIERFFAVQCRVLPYLVSSAEAELVRDAVVCAPTGSGKTLVYVLALLQGLRERRVVRLRGLVVVPNRDLAIQVASELHRYAPAVGLKVGLAIGQSDFAQEQRVLVGSGGDDEDEEEEEDEQEGSGASTPAPHSSPLRRLLLRRRRRCRRPPRQEEEQQLLLRGGRSKVDVLVATPGRLMDHVERTPGFTLQHLRYLVLDEVDRLVNQSYQNWAPRVQDAAYGQEAGVAALSLPQDSSGSSSRVDEEYVLRPTTVRIRPRTQRESARLPFLPPTPLRKLLFSATFTSDPQKAAMLDLRNPRYFSVTGAMSEGDAPAARLAALTASWARDAKKTTKTTTRRPAIAGGVDEENEELAAEGEVAVSTPATLREEYLVCESREKPLVLLALLERELRAGAEGGIVLVFTSSLDSTHRLCRLLQLCALASSPSDPDSGSGDGMGGSVREFSSSLSQPQRAELIRRCLDTKGHVRVLVSSDGMARGMDLPNVAAVVNYDVPTQAKTYVHRVGRTARAGRAGRAVSLLKKGQEAQFTRMRGVVDQRVVDRLSLKRLGDLAPLQPGYHRALRALKEVLSRERQGKLRVAEPLGKEAHKVVLAAMSASSTAAVAASEDGGDGEEEEEEGEI